MNDVGIAITAGSVTAVTHRTGVDAEAVLIDGWPSQDVDARDDEQVRTALRRIHDRVWSDVDRVVIAHPVTFAPKRVHRLRESMTAMGWSQVRVISVPVAVSMTRANADPRTASVVLDATAQHLEASALVPQPSASWGQVASTITDTTGDPPAAVDKATTAADVRPSDVGSVLVIDAPPAAKMVLRQLTAYIVVAVSPVDLAAHALEADAMLVEDHQDGVAGRSRRSWPRPLSSTGCAVASLVLLGAITIDAGTSVFQPDTGMVALACLGLATAALGVASFIASRNIAGSPGPRGWRSAARSIVIGASAGVVLVLAAVAYVSTVFAGQLWPTLLASMLATAPSLLAAGVIAHDIHAHPDAPPHRRLWPPVGAMTAVCAAALVVHGAGPWAVTPVGWESVPMRLGVGAWLFAITGLIVSSAPWPRVGIGLLLAVLAAPVVSPTTIPIAAGAVVVVVSGWWVVRAGQVRVDRYGSLFSRRTSAVPAQGGEAT